MSSRDTASEPGGEAIVGEGVALIETAEEAGGAQRIPVNMYETDEAIVVVAPMPGVTADEVQIAVQGRHLDIRAELRTDAPKRYLLHEWDYGAYSRTVELPTDTPGDITASLGNGQLAVSIRRDGTPDSPRRVVKPGGPSS